MRRKFSLLGWVLVLLLAACSPYAKLPLPAPSLLSRSPATGEQLSLDAPVALTFDQPMDAGSVEDAFDIEPPVQGTLEWRDERTLTFKPRTALARGTVYSVTVGYGAKNADGTALEDPIFFDFSTVGFLSVTEVQPFPGADEIDPGGAVTVVFDRPVVALTAIENLGDLPNPLSFDPPVEGTGEWLNTFIYRFQPALGFQPATTYRAQVEGGLQDTIGTVMEDPYNWTFSTLSPAIYDYSPENSARHVGPEAVIRMTFNQPMDHTSVESHFSLRVNDEPVSGVFAWSGGEYPTTTETMVFTPSVPFPRGASATAVLTGSVKDFPFALGRPGDPAGRLEQRPIWQFQPVKNAALLNAELWTTSENVDGGGGVTFKFASPMDTGAFREYVFIDPPVPDPRFRWGDYDTELDLSFNRLPGTTYTVRLKAGAPDRYGMKVDRGAEFSFTTGNRPPYVLLNTDTTMGLYNAYSETTIYAGYRNISQLDVRLYRLPAETWIWWQSFSNYDSRRSFRPPAEDLLHAWSEPVEPLLNKGYLTPVTMRDPDGGDLPPGVYYVEIAAPEAPETEYNYDSRRYFFIRTRLNLTLKQSHTESLVWATDLASGEPATGVPLHFYEDSMTSGRSGTTDADGLHLVEGLNIIDLYDPYFVVSGESGSEDFAIAYNGWNDGVRPWNFGVQENYTQRDTIGYLYTERPLYRPGQPVYFKGILRADDDAHYSVPSDKTRVVYVEDPQGKLVYQATLTFNDWGSLYDEFQLDEDAALGTYTIWMADPAVKGSDSRWQSDASATFRVLEYSKPEYQVELSTDRDAYLNGEMISAAVDASYYFGGPVADASVQWNVLSSGFSFSYHCPPSEGACPRYSWTDYSAYRYDESYGGRDRQLASGITKADADGAAFFQTLADISEETGSRQFILEATVTDINGQAVSSRAVAVVHRGKYYIGVAPQGRIGKADEEKAVDILTVDWDSEPVSAGPLQVVFLEHRWYSVRKQEDDGGFYWTWEVEDVPIYTTTVSTGEDGKAMVNVTPPSSGSYRIIVSGTDDAGNEIRSSTYLWVWGGGWAPWRQESSYRIDLIADKDEYQVGDVAEVLIPSPYSGPVYALVTIERGHILESRVMRLESNSELLRIPIVEDHIPNVFVSVMLMEGSEGQSEGLASFKMGMIKLPVQVSEKDLRITVTSDRDMEAGEYYRPRETASFDVQVTDSMSRPVQTELSMRLTDLAVLALADETGPTLLERYWSERGVDVRTSVPLIVAMEKYTRDLVPGAKGGGSGAAGGFVRTDFKDTAFWEPALRTDESGRAHVEVKLPDNLTTWRMQARGVTPGMYVGRSEMDILCTLDMLVRAVLPRFFIVGDRAEIATIVHNNTPEDRRVQVSLTAPGLDVEGGTQQTVDVPAGDKVKVVWPVEVKSPDDPAGQSDITIKMEARSGDYYDGREDTLPVYRPTTPEVVATSGQLSEAGIRQELVYLPQEYDPNQGELLLKLNGSLTAGVQGSLKYLEHYPYECVEQTVSRFLPNVLTYQVLDELGAAEPGLRQSISTQVSVALQRLYAWQRYDGGWGWWPDSIKSDSYITAYALQGLLEAHRAGFAVEPQVIHRAASYLRENLSTLVSGTSRWQANRLAYQLYVLAEYRDMFDVRSAEFNVLGIGAALFEQRRYLDHYGQATLALALSLLEEPNNLRSDTLLANLVGDAVMSATGTHWEEGTPDYRNMNSDVRTTAIVLWSMSRLRPDDPLLPNAVRWLMETRQLDATGTGFRPYWESTNTTSWALMGLVAYMRASGEMEGDFDYTVYLNNKHLEDGVVNAETLDETHELRIEIAELLAGEANRLIIEREEPPEDQTGKGQLYYSAYLRYYLPTEDIPALDRGISIARQYEPVTVHPDTSPGVAYVGDIVRVNITLVVPDNLYYVILEDPLPAGFEAVDVSLNTTSMLAEGPSMRRESLSRWGYGGWWFSHTELRDEKVAVFASYLPRGTYQFNYHIRAGVPGVYNVLPTMAYEMYFPEVFGRSDGVMYTVLSADNVEVPTFPTPTPAPTSTPRPTPTVTPTGTPGPTPTPLPFEAVLVEGVPAQSIRHMWNGPQGQLWLATDEGVLVRNGNGWTTLNERPAERILGSDAIGRVWVLLEEGASIAVYDGATWTNYGSDRGWQPPVPPPLDDEGVPVVTPRFGVWGDVISDVRGGVWLAAGQDEVRYLDPQSGTWRTFAAEDLGFTSPGGRANPGHLLTDVAQDFSGNVWVGECLAYNDTLRGQGVRWFNGEVWSGSRDTQEECVYAIEVDVDGSVWIGGRFALTRYDPSAQAFNKITLPQWPDYQVVADLKLDGQGGAWVELWRTGSRDMYTQRALFHLSEGTWHEVYQAPLETSDPALDAGGTAWFCSEAMLTRAQDSVKQSVPYLPFDEPVPDENTCQIAVDGSNQVWLTDGRRLWRVR